MNDSNILDDSKPTTSSSISPYIQMAGFVLVLVIVISVIDKVTTRNEPKYSADFIRKVQSLLKNCAQWALTSQQDQNPIVALMHINYALAYATLVKRLISSKEAERIAKVNLDELITALENEQIQAMKRIHKVAPNLNPEGIFAINTGWIA